MPKELTVITPVIRPELVERMLDTLYEYTEPMFYVYLIDMTVHGLDSTKLRNKFKNLMVIRTPKSDTHYTGNLGFAQATNLGIQLVQTPYFMMCNDDVEFIHPKWWAGVLATFDKVEEATPERPAVIVNPSSIRLADWSVGRASGDDFDIIPYKEQYTDADWNFLINEDHYVNKHLTIKPDTVIDGVTMYASVCHTRRFLEVGLLDEKYFSGGGEDYDYSCRASMLGYRSVGTTLSYVFHHWSSTFKALQEEMDVKSLQMPELNWNGTSEKWGSGFDIWGVKCPKYMGKRWVNEYEDEEDPEKITGKHEEDWWCHEGMRAPRGSLVATCPKHPDQKYDIPDSTVMPL